MTLFVDSSVFYAGADRGDSSHTSAAALLKSESLVTTDHVLAETWLLLNARLGRPAAERFWEGLRSGAAELEPVGPGDLERAWSIGQEFPDQDFSLVDRTSFAVMLRLGVHRVASFDDDFLVFRFGHRRERAFEVLR
ncbi:MAG: PIN domain-containing protein [Chloroflexi bacterium]|nr:PIN domain-containing protein [Chloroflexota bacterium]